VDTRFEVLKEIRGFLARMAGTVINNQGIYSADVPAKKDGR